MIILSKDKMKNIFLMHEAIQASKDALCIHTKGNTIVPLRTNIHLPNQQDQCLFMPAYVDDIKMAGIKIVSVFPANPVHGKPSVLGQMLLIDGESGEVCAMLDGTYLTQLRTGALQGAATDILARKNAKIAVLFGTGGQAATQLEAMLTVRKLDEVRVIDIDPNRAKLFVDTMQKIFPDTAISVFNDGNEAILDADIITTITTSKSPVFDGTLIKKGAHVNGIGAYTPDMQELPDILIKNADKIIFDTKEGVLAEAGDILIPLKKGLVTMMNFNGDLGDVILGNIQGRESEDEITVFKAVGTAVLDIVTANAIYQRAI